MRKNFLATASAVALIVAAPLISGCAEDIQPSAYGLPGNGWYAARQAPVYALPVAQAAPVMPLDLSNDAGDDKPASIDLGPVDGPVPQQAAMTGGALPQLNSGTVHDLADAAGGYIIGRQAEHLIRKTIQRRRLAAAAEDAAGVGAGAAMTRATTGSRAVTALEGGAGAAEGEEGAAAAGAALRGGAAITEGEGAAIGGGEALAEGGLALGAGEVAVGAAIAAGAAILGYEVYQAFQHSSEQQKAGQ